MLSPQDKERLKKKQQLEFRRFIIWKATGRHLRHYLGADIGEIRDWIESNWQPGMTWDNYGDYWVVDHIVPLRMFDLTKEEDLKICWHYKNLMPLLKEDNLKKEGNVFFAFELLHDLRHKDFFYNELFKRIWPEVKYMVKYISTFHRRYGSPAKVRTIRGKKLTA